jgi:hypothetical protein
MRLKMSICTAAGVSPCTQILSGDTVTVPPPPATRAVPKAP